MIKPPNAPSRRRWLPSCAIAAALVFSASAWGTQASDKVVRVATGEWPPYSTASRKDGGLTINVLRRALALSGYRMELSFMPWSRALHETAKGHFDITAHWGETQQRHATFFLSDNLVTERWVLVHRRDSGFDWQGPQDLQRFTLGLVPDYSYTSELWSAVGAGRQKREAPADDITALKMLLTARIDAVPMATEVACELAQTQLPDQDQQRLAIHHKALIERFTTHALLPRSSARSESLHRDINRGLKQLRASGEMDKLLKHTVKCPAGWLLQP
jgi:polar amino acid transport system substrate-binding protein